MSETDIAHALLGIGAVGFATEEPITFKSGLLSPVYIDNRQLIYWPEQWRTIVQGFKAMASGLQFDIIAGIETAGIPHSSALAYEMAVPSVFVRKQVKAHGTRSRVEGGSVDGKRVLLIEDLVTTGGSSLAGVAALREDGAEVTDCLCITTYGFAMSGSAFKALKVQLHPLVTFDVIIQTAHELGYFDTDKLAIIQDWRRNPHEWGTRHGLG